MIDILKYQPYKKYIWNSLYLTTFAIFLIVLYFILSKDPNAAGKGRLTVLFVGVILLFYIIFDLYKFFGDQILPAVRRSSSRKLTVD